MLITIADYCAQRNVSKQFVYEYIRKGKLTVLDLPTFIEFKGEKVHLGMQKMLDVPEVLAPKAKDAKPLPPLDSELNMTIFIEGITDSPFLRDFYAQYLTATDANEKKSLKQKFHSMLKNAENGAALSAEFDEANLKIMQHMRKQGEQIKQILEENRKKLIVS